MGASSRLAHRVFNGRNVSWGVSVKLRLSGTEQKPAVMSRRPCFSHLWQLRVPGLCAGKPGQL